MGTGADGVGSERFVDVGSLIQAGLLKTNLSEIVIAGKLTLFQPPAESEDEADAAAGDVENPDETSTDDAAASDSSAGDKTDSTSDGDGTQPENSAGEPDGTAGDSLPDDSAPAEANTVVAPPATPARETKQADESTSSPKDEQPE